MHQKGFSSFALILLVLAVGMIGVLGFQVYQKNADQSVARADNQKQKDLEEGLANGPDARANASAKPVDEAFARKNLEGYDTLPQDFKQTIRNYLGVVQAVCDKNPLQENPSPTAGGQIEKVVRGSYISANLQQEDCEGGARLYFAKVGKGWQQPFRTTGLNIDCSKIDKYTFTREIIPQCYRGGKIVDNKNP